MTHSLKLKALSICVTHFSTSWNTSSLHFYSFTVVLSGFQDYIFMCSFVQDFIVYKSPSRDVHRKLAKAINAGVYGTVHITYLFLYRKLINESNSLSDPSLLICNVI